MNIVQTKVDQAVPARAMVSPAPELSTIHTTRAVSVNAADGYQ